MSSYQSLPSSLRFAGVQKGFQPAVGANVFNALGVACFNADFAKASCFRSSLWDLRVRLLMALRLSLANSPGLFQGDSPN